MVSVSLATVESTSTEALLANGASPTVAASVAKAVATAEGNNNRICGLYYLASYCHHLASGRVNGTAEPEVVVDRPGAVRVDGKLGFAQPAFDAGFETAVAAAKTNGICGYAIEHTETATAIGYFTERLAAAGMVAIGSTNASARVAPPGGSTPVLGTNPIAMSVPDGEGGIAFQFDFSTSAVALGRITMAAAAGESIPEGWAVDADGKPTTDPDAALKGSLVSMGGYKGYGIGLLVEVLGALLTGGRLSSDVPPLKTPEGPPHNLGQFYIIIDPEGYGRDRFYDSLSGLVESITTQPGARLPGRHRSPQDPIEVDQQLWDASLELASPA